MVVAGGSEDAGTHGRERMSRIITQEEAQDYEIGGSRLVLGLCFRFPWLIELAARWFQWNAKRKWTRYVRTRTAEEPEQAPVGRRRGIIRHVGTIRIRNGELNFDGWSIEPAGAQVFEPTPEGPLFFGYSIPELFEIVKRPSEFEEALP